MHAPCFSRLPVRCHTDGAGGARPGASTTIPSQAGRGDAAVDGLPLGDSDAVVSARARSASSSSSSTTRSTAEPFSPVHRLRALRRQRCRVGVAVQRPNPARTP